MTTETTTPETEAAAEPVEAVPADGAWGLFRLMGHKTIAGRAIPDPVLGGGTVLVQTPAADGVTLRKAQSFQPATGLYLAEWCTRQEVLDFLYPPVRTQLALTRTSLDDEIDDDPYVRDDDEDPL